MGVAQLGRFRTLFQFGKCLEELFIKYDKIGLNETDEEGSYDASGLAIQHNFGLDQWGYWQDSFAHSPILENLFKNRN